MYVVPRVVVFTVIERLELTEEQVVVKVEVDLTFCAILRVEYAILHCNSGC